MDLLGGRQPLRQRAARGGRRLGAGAARATSTASSTSCWRSARCSSPTSSPACSPTRTGARPPAGWSVPRMPLDRDAVLVAVATVGTTLAPWGLAFIQSYAVDKRLHVEDLRYERVDVDRRRGADRGDRLLRRRRLRGDAARRRASRSTTPATPPARSSRSPAASRRPCSALGLPRRGAARGGDRAALDRLLGLGDARPQGATSTTASPRRGPSTSPSARWSRSPPSLVLIPGAPLIPILFLSQALNAVLLLVLLPFMRLARQGPGADGRARAGPGRAPRSPGSPSP